MLNITAESNGLIQSLSVAVISLNGLVYSKNFKNSNDLRMFNFNLKITQKMAPEASVIVFYVKEQNGDIVFDEFKIELGFAPKNYVRKYQPLISYFFSNYIFML